MLEEEEARNSQVSQHNISRESRAFRQSEPIVFRKSNLNNNNQYNINQYKNSQIKNNNKDNSNILVSSNAVPIFQDQQYLINK